MSLLRVAFTVQNASFFNELAASLFVTGIYFDGITVAFLGLPMLLFVNPLTSIFNLKVKMVLNRLVQIYLASITLLILVLNTWDIAYFSYTQKRSGFSYFVHLLTGTETSSLAGEFLAEFWWLPILFLVMAILLGRLILKVEYQQKSKSIKSDSFQFIALSLAVFILARGGLQLRPVGIIDATAMSSLEQAPIVLNTTFTVLKTINDGTTSPLRLHRPEELRSLLPKKTSDPIGILPKNTNVVVLILESFGTNYAGPNSPNSYSPFLDSLLEKGLFFEHAIANGRTSMDAVPAILAGLPSWLPESYILSPYCGNQLNSLPQTLKDIGYQTSFYHGAKEGSMNFKSFTKAIGIDAYIGLESYPNQSHFDGNWGVWDHNMLSYFGRQLAQERSPFFSTLFTLSSHHPYAVPSTFESQLKTGPEALCKTISYTDKALSSFFKQNQNKAWFKNTLFVITADHVGPTRQKQFQTLDWRYRIPIGFYHPTVALPKPNKGVVFQQIDLLPTVLDLLGIQKLPFQLGSSCYAREQSQKMVYDNGNLLSFIYNGTNLLPIAWSPGIKRSYTPEQAGIGKKMSALYQFYLNSLIENRCSKQTIKPRLP
jgi:phosphoglycerol transferase MdoB-like AlkP superfamily enzyme